MRSAIIIIISALIPGRDRFRQIRRALVGLGWQIIFYTNDKLHITRYFFNLSVLAVFRA